MFVQRLAGPSVGARDADTAPGMTRHVATDETCGMGPPGGAGHPPAGLCLRGGGGVRGSQGQLQWRLQVTHEAVWGSYWRLEGRLQVVGGQAKA